MEAEATKADFGLLRAIVLRHSHNVLDPARDYLFEARLAGVVRRHGLRDLRELMDMVATGRDRDLERSIAEAMTVNETSFFRDSRPFDLLRNVILPRLIKARRSTQALRFWSAGCSTGQEAYSLLMLIRDAFPQIGHWRLRVDGTDISKHVIEQAKSGRYRQIEMNRGLPPHYAERFFERQGEEWVVKPELRAFCRFRHADLCGASVFLREQFDVILMRNVLLYFNAEQRKCVLSEAHRLLAPDGALFLGASEQPADASRWTVELAGGTCYLRPKE